ncbi:hypothetical protein BAC2_00977 [uncultured bacterium]|nr:hypothetical protein BAC2_00977 [uncultured bacterium]
MNSSIVDKAQSMKAKLDVREQAKREEVEHVEGVKVAKAVELVTERTRGRAKVKVTARLNGEILAVDKFDLGDSKARGRFAVKLVDKGAGDLPEIESRLLGLAAVPTFAPEPVVTDREALLAERDEDVERRLATMPGDIVNEARARLCNPDLLDIVMADIESVGVVGERPLAATTFLIGVSRLLPKPLAGMVQGVSSSGKSFVPNAVSTLFPPESVLRAHGITANALYYLDPGSLMHRLVVAGERPRQQDDSQADATKPLREMIADGELTKLVTERSQEGKNVTREVHQPGPIAYMESTTAAVVFDEDVNRMLALSSDESAEQSKKITQAQARRATGKRSDPSRTIAVHHAMQRMLKRCTVNIPFAAKLANSMPHARPECRRAFPHLIAMIQACALLHQFQRVDEPQHGIIIQAQSLDYAVAKRLLNSALGRALGEGLPAAVVNFGKRCWAEFANTQFTTKGARQKDAALKSKSKVNEYLNALADAGFAEKIQESKGRTPASWKMLGDVPEGGADWLPSIQDIVGTP